MSVLKDCSTCTMVLTWNRCNKCKSFSRWINEKKMWRESTEVSQWKSKYNDYLKQHEKAAIYMDNNEIPLEKRETWINKYKSIVMELDYILALFYTDGIAYTNDEVLEGFNDGKNESLSVRQISK